MEYICIYKLFSVSASNFKNFQTTDFFVRLIFICFKNGPSGPQVKHSCPPLCLDVLKMDQAR